MPIIQENEQPDMTYKVMPRTSFSVPTSDQIAPPTPQNSDLAASAGTNSRPIIKIVLIVVAVLLLLAVAAMAYTVIHKKQVQKAEDRAKADQAKQEQQA